MCPICMTSAAVLAAGTTTCAGALGLVAVKFRSLFRKRRAPPAE